INGYQYQYDQDNRLTQLKDSSAALVAEFTYDALGRRIEKIQYDTGANITTRYTYDGWRVLTETDQADPVQRDYVYGNYIDEVVMMIDAADHYFAHDHLFSPAALLGSDGTVVERYEYNAYGNATVFTDDGADNIWFTSDDTTANTSAQNNPYTFTSQRLDNLDSDALQIMYYKNRYYFTETGRFLQRDPIGVMDELGILKFKQTGSPIIPRTFEVVRQYIDGENLYQYVQSKPTRYTDPSGQFLKMLWACCRCISKLMGVADECAGKYREDQIECYKKFVDPIDQTDCLEDVDLTKGDCFDDLVREIPDCARCIFDFYTIDPS
ncbi:MAG: hypothetical protein IID32_01520, partial [Planctomycetes bacterium]|nr:hypothetical protein [Planctomycetota bacterium]